MNRLHVYISVWPTYQNICYWKWYKVPELELNSLHILSIITLWYVHKWYYLICWYYTAWIGIWMTKKPGATSDNSFIFLHIYAYIAGINIPAVLSTEPRTATESVVSVAVLDWTKKRTLEKWEKYSQRRQGRPCYR